MADDNQVANTPEISPEQRQDIVTCIEAVMRLANEMAVSVGEHLKSDNANLEEFSAADLLQLAIDLRVSKWIAGGLQVKGMEVEESHPGALAEEMPGPSILKAWFEHIGWSATSELNVDIQVESTSEEELVNELAELLWTLRHLAQSDRELDT